MDAQVKVGLALGSGSARGFAHIGVIRVLEAEGIPIHCVAGASIGAIVGASYASGTWKNYEEFLAKLEVKNIPFLLDPVIPTSGLFGGKRLVKLFESLLQERNLEDFPLPFAAIAADIATGEEVVLTTGNAVKAIRASMSLPGIFTPVWFHNRFLVDGGIVSPVPVRATQMLGADVVIAVNLAAEMTSRSYISTVKKTAEQFQEIEKAQVTERNVLENLFQTAYLSKGMPEFVKEKIEQGKILVEGRAQALEEWFDKKVEQGRALLEEKTPSFDQWFRKEEESADLPDIFSILLNAINIMQFEIARSTLRSNPPDILLTPELGKIRLLDFAKAEECIQEGERVAREALPKIRAAIASGFVENYKNSI